MDNSNNGVTSREMPRYACHKVVHALKIKHIDNNQIVPEDAGFAPFNVADEFITKHQPEAGGYYVVYDDGYKSFSPAEAFEKGYMSLNLVFYGPHPCQKCDPTGKQGTMIVKAGNGADDSLEFEFTHDAHYPNHVWRKHQHVAQSN